MSKKENPCVVILGAGPAGLGAAYQLAQRGIKCVVLEKLGRVGGNAGSFELAGIPVDFGSHRFHPATHPDILAMVRRLLGEDLLTRPRHGRIRLMGRWLHFPLKASDLAVNAPPRFVMGVAKDLLAKILPAKNEQTKTFSSILKRGLGHTICKEFYFPYAQKIWGMNPAELSPIQAQKRVSSSSIASMLRKLLPAMPGSDKSRTQGKFYYPRNGFGQISEALYKAALNAGAEVRLETEVSRLVLAQDEHKVEFMRGGKLHTINTQHIWSTIPITQLTRLSGTPVPEDVRNAANSLRFRGMLLIYLVLDTQQFTPFDAHYLPGADIRITRLSEPKNYSARQRPPDTTILCAELPCQPGDEFWAMDDKALEQLVLEDLDQAGRPVACDVRQILVKRLPQAYPLYPVGFEKNFELLDTWVDGLDNVLTFGRQGLYAHDNTHHALYMACAAAKCLQANGTFDRQLWDRERAVFSTHVVED